MNVVIAEHIQQRNVFSKIGVKVKAIYPSSIFLDALKARSIVTAADARTILSLSDQQSKTTKLFDDLILRRANKDGCDLLHSFYLALCDAYESMACSGEMDVIYDTLRHIRQQGENGVHELH